MLNMMTHCLPEMLFVGTDGDGETDWLFDGDIDAIWNVNMWYSNEGVNDVNMCVLDGYNEGVDMVHMWELMIDG